MPILFYQGQYLEGQYRTSLIFNLMLKGKILIKMHWKDTFGLLGSSNSLQMQEIGTCSRPSMSFAPGTSLTSVRLPGTAPIFLSYSSEDSRVITSTPPLFFGRKAYQHICVCFSFKNIVLRLTFCSTTNMDEASLNPNLQPSLISRASDQ